MRYQLVILIISSFFLQGCQPTFQAESSEDGSLLVLGTKKQCAPDQHPDNLRDTCEPNSISCPVTKGHGVSVWSGNSYGACGVQSCDLGFEKVGDQCLAASPGATPTPSPTPTTGLRDFTSDRNKFFGASRCAQAGLQLCEDFEAGTVSNAWSISGSVVVEGGMSARGTKAMHIHKVGNGSAYIKEKVTFPARNNTYYGRVFVNFQSIPKAPMTSGHWTILAATGTGVSGEVRFGSWFHNNLSYFGVGTDGPTGDWTQSDNDPAGAPRSIPLNEWVCIEWMHKGDTSDTKVWWDGVEHPSMATSLTKHGGNSSQFKLPTFNSLWIGWSEYQTSTQTFDLWIDEIGIDSERIGCVQ